MVEPAASAPGSGIQVRELGFARAATGAAGEGFRLAVEELVVEPGRAVACIGPSGCAKTTLLHLVAGILTPDRGSVRVDGVELVGMPAVLRRRFRLRRVGLVFQEFELLEHLSVAENVLLPWSMGSGVGAAARQRLAELAEATGIAALLRRRPQRLSQGERQRVAICRALITAPRVLLADEPTGNLDPRTGGRVLDLLLEQAAAHGAALLMVTHDHALLSRFDAVVDLGAAVGAAVGARAEAGH